MDESGTLRPTLTLVGELRSRAAALGAAVTLGAITLVGISCSGESEELTPPPPAETATAQAAAQPANTPVQPQVAAGTQETMPFQPLTPAGNTGMTAEQLADVLANLQPEQRAALGPNPTPEQIAALLVPAPPDVGPLTGEQALAALDNDEDTALGRIDMEAVQAAFNEATDVADFETRLNRIYEGDHMMLVRVQNEAGATVTQAWEDLDDTGEIVDAIDDLVFALTFTHQNRSARLQGHGVNSYFNYAYPPTAPPTGAFWNGFILANMARPQWVYVTPPARRTVVVNDLNVYRGTPAWVARRQASRAYYQRMRTTHPQWRPAVVTVTPARRAVWARRHHQPRPPRVVIQHAPPPGVYVNAPPPPRVVINAPTPPRVVVHPPTPPRVVVHPPTPPRVVVRPAPPPRVVVRPAPPPRVVVQPGPRPHGPGPRHHGPPGGGVKVRRHR